MTWSRLWKQKMLKTCELAPGNGFGADDTVVLDFASHNSENVLLSGRNVVKLIDLILDECKVPIVDGIYLVSTAAANCLEPTGRQDPKVAEGECQWLRNRGTQLDNRRLKSRVGCLSCRLPRTSRQGH